MNYCGQCGIRVPDKYPQRARKYCSEVCIRKADKERKRKWTIANHEKVIESHRRYARIRTGFKPRTCCKQCGGPMPSRVRYTTKQYCSDACLVNSIREREKKRRLSHLDKVRESSRQYARKILAERKRGLRPPKQRYTRSPVSTLKTKWKKELLQWEPELREARIRLAEARKRLNIGKQLRHPEAWPSLIEVLKREAILPT